MIWVLFGPGEEVEVGGFGVVPGELAGGFALELVRLEEGREGLVDGVADVETFIALVSASWEKGMGREKLTCIADSPRYWDLPASWKPGWHDTPLSPSP